jgi:phosphoglycolate phosphatase
MAYESLIFDLDGTLVDTVDDIAASMGHAMAELGLEAPSRSTVVASVGAGVVKLVERLVAEATKRDAVRAAFTEHYNAHLLDRTRLFPEVAETLAALDGMPMAVLTNKPEGMSRRIIEGLGIARHFRAVCGGDTLPVRKPDPAGARRLLAELGGKALFVGDSGVDVETARNAGLPCCAATYGYHRPGELDRADYRIDRFGELIRIVRATP